MEQTYARAVLDKAPPVPQPPNRVRLEMDELTARQLKVFLGNVSLTQYWEVTRSCTTKSMEILNSAERYTHDGYPKFISNIYDTLKDVLT